MRNLTRTHHGRRPERARARFGGSVATLAAVSLLVLAGCSGPEKGVQATRAEPASVDSDGLSGITESWIHLDHGVWVPVVDDFGRYLQSARLDYEQGEMAAAAHELGVCAERLGRQVDKASSELNRDRLKAAIVELDGVAADLKAGREVSEGRLNRAVERAYRAGIADRWFAVSPADWFSFVGRPDQHLREAYRQFVNGDPGDAADEILKGAAFIELEETRADCDAIRAMARTVFGLRSLAGELELGRVQDPLALRLAFARTDRALADYYAAKAVEAWNAEQTHLVGHELDTAMAELDSCLDWMQDSRTAGLSGTMDTAREAAGHVVTAEQIDLGDAKRAIDAVQVAVQQVGNRLSRY